jgi:PAS domain S-box-containing protein
MLYAKLALSIVSVVCSALATFALIWYKLLLPLRRIRETLQSYMGGKTESRIALEGGGEVVLIAGEIDFLLDYLEETKESNEFSEQRFRALFQNNTEGMIVITGQGFITDINQAAETIFGYAPGELIGARVERLMPAEHANNHSEYLTRYLSTGEARVIGTTGRELQGIRKNGERFPLRLGVGEVRSGHANYFVATIIDLSEIAELQSQLERSQDHDVIN